MSEELRVRLGRLARGKSAREEIARPTPAPTGRRRKGPPSLESLLPGRELQTDRGVCWLHERQIGQWPGTDEKLAARMTETLAAPAPADLERDSGWNGWRERGLDSGLFLDLETTGLSGTPVFLCGLLSADAGAMSFRLLLARDYAEEAALLTAVAAEIAIRPVVITYNGKSYDLPFLGERSARLRVNPCRPAAHLDLLHPARRRWSARLPDCRLKTLEWHLLGRHRSGDIDGSKIPDTYHRFVRDRDPRPLVRVMAHNLQDLYTLAELAVRTAQTPVPPPIMVVKIPDI